MTLPEYEILRTLVLDLDGTVRHGFDELGRFVNGPDDVVIFDGVVEAMRAYRDAGWIMIGLSNQGGVALGHSSMADMAAATRRTQQLCDDLLIQIACCMHHPNAADPALRHCYCRKPLYGGLVLAVNRAAERMAKHMAKHLRVPVAAPPDAGLFVGDRDEDHQCAQAVGMPFMWAKDWRAGGWRKPLTPPSWPG